MTLNATDISPNQDCSSSASSASNECPKNEAANEGPAAACADPEQLNRDEKSNDSTIVGDDANDQATIMEIDCVAVCSTSEQPEKDEGSSDDDRTVASKKKKDKDVSLDSPKKRSKSTPQKSSSPPTSSKSNSSLIAKPKLQINDKTLKKLRTDTDDLIFEDASNNPESGSQHQPSNNHLSHNSPSAKLKTSNNCLMPVVNNVLSRSIAAIFKSSPVTKNGEFVNSYSALGFNKGPRVKRVCRTFSDVYRGQPRAVFPLPTNQRSKVSKTASANSSPSKQRKSGKKPPKNQSSTSSSAAQSASTSKSNSNSSFKEDDSTIECSYDCDSDDLEITDYIARNLKREMESKDISV